MAIITYLYNEDFRHYLEGGVNPLQTMFSSRYEYIPLEDLILIFYDKLAPYKRAMEDSFFLQLSRIQTSPTIGRYLTETYAETMDRIDKKRHKSYEYVVDERERNLSIIYSHCLIMQRIYKIIWEREQDGFDQTATKMDLYEFFQKTPTKGNLTTFQQLFAEANTQLGLLKLPEEFIKYKEIIHR